jgi:acetolactate synthase small subunit
MLQATGSTERLDAMELMLDKYGILELVRTGKVIMARGEAGT